MRWWAPLELPRGSAVGCGRGYCEYQVICKGGGRRSLAFASRALVF